MQQPTVVLKIKKPEPKCVKLKVPKCKATDEAEPVEICSFSGQAKNLNLEAKLFEAENVKRCDTHYSTSCRPGYGYKPHCVSIPTQNCYDVPVLREKDVPIRARGTESEARCRDVLIPTPRSICWEEEVEICSEVPELVEQDEHLNKCAPAVGEDECAKVRLTIPREICSYVQVYQPYYPPPPPQPYIS